MLLIKEFGCLVIWIIGKLINFVFICVVDIDININGRLICKF